MDGSVRLFVPSKAFLRYIEEGVSGVRFVIQIGSSMMVLTESGDETVFFPKHGSVVRVILPVSSQRGVGSLCSRGSGGFGQCWAGGGREWGARVAVE